MPFAIRTMVFKHRMIIFFCHFQFHCVYHVLYVFIVQKKKKEVYGFDTLLLTELYFLCICFFFNVKSTCTA